MTGGASRLKDSTTRRPHKRLWRMLNGPIRDRRSSVYMPPWRAGWTRKLGAIIARDNDIYIYSSSRFHSVLGIPLLTFMMRPHETWFYRLALFQTSQQCHYLRKTFLSHMSHKSIPIIPFSLLGIISMMIFSSVKPVLSSIWFLNTARHDTWTGVQFKRELRTNSMAIY